MRGSFRNYTEILTEDAAENGGYFTSSQAVAAGFADSVHGIMVRKGTWLKVMRGIYRLASFPEPAWPELTIYSLWSRDRSGCPQGVYTHDTALSIHAGIISSQAAVHMTVPLLFRKHASVPKGLMLHKQDLPAEAWEQRDGYRVLGKEWMDEAGRFVPPAAGCGKVQGYDAVIQAGED